MRGTPQNSPTNAVIERIKETGCVEEADGNSIEIPYGADGACESGRILYDLIRKHRLDRSLEIGMAYGVSTLHICQAHLRHLWDGRYKVYREAEELHVQDLCAIRKEAGSDEGTGTVSCTSSTSPLTTSSYAWGRKGGAELPPDTFDVFVSRKCENFYAPKPIEQHLSWYRREYEKYLARFEDAPERPRGFW